MGENDDNDGTTRDNNHNDDHNDDGEGARRRRGTRHDHQPPQHPQPPLRATARRVETGSGKVKYDSGGQGDNTKAGGTTTMAGRRRQWQRDGDNEGNNKGGTNGEGNRSKETTMMAAFHTPPLRFARGQG